MWFFDSPCTRDLAYDKTAVAVYTEARASWQCSSIVQHQCCASVFCYIVCSVAYILSKAGPNFTVNPKNSAETGLFVISSGARSTVRVVYATARREGRWHEPALTSLLPCYLRDAGANPRRLDKIPKMRTKIINTIKCKPTDKNTDRHSACKMAHNHCSALPVSSPCSMNTSRLNCK